MMAFITLVFTRIINPTHISHILHKLQILSYILYTHAHKSYISLTTGLGMAGVVFIGQLINSMTYECTILKLLSELTLFDEGNPIKFVVIVGKYLSNVYRRVPGPAQSRVLHISTICAYS